MDRSRLTGSTAQHNAPIGLSSHLHRLSPTRSKKSSSVLSAHRPASDGDAAARYRDVFAVVEFRALFAAHLLSLIGDQLSKLGVSVLVYDRTGSALAAAITFGISYLPWALVGPVLATFSDQFSRRAVMISCDLSRAVLIGALFGGLMLPDFPVWAIVAVLFVSALFAPPAQAARSAILPDVLTGDSYVVAVSVNVLSFQCAQVVGFAGGGALLAVLSAREVLLADALTFAVSTVLVRLFVVSRRHTSSEVSTRTRPSAVFRQTADGIRLVLTDPAPRAFVLLAWIGVAFRAGPDGVMAAYAVHLGDTGLTAEMTVGLLLAATPFGTVCGAIIYGRLTRPNRRWRLVRPMALLMCLGLTPVLLDPPFLILLLLLAVAGFGAAYHGPLGARFVRDVPASHRGRAAGISTTGMMASTGLTTPLAGALADTWADPSLVIGLCGVTGLILMLPVVLRWPDKPQAADGGRVPRPRPSPE